MVPARAGSHRERLQAELAQEGAELECGVADAGVRLVAGIEVEGQPVGAGEAVGAAEPCVQGDACLTGQVDEGCGVGRDDVSDRSALLGDRHALDPGREVTGGVLLDDARAVDAVRVALEAQRAAREVGQHRPGDGRVVGGDVGLGDSRGEQRLVGSGDVDVAPVGADDQAEGCHAASAATCSTVRPLSTDSGRVAMGSTPVVACSSRFLTSSQRSRPRRSCPIRVSAYAPRSL